MIQPSGRVSRKISVGLLDVVGDESTTMVRAEAVQPGVLDPQPPAVPWRSTRAGAERQQPGPEDRAATNRSRTPLEIEERQGAVRDLTPIVGVRAFPLALEPESSDQVLVCFSRSGHAL